MTYREKRLTMRTVMVRALSFSALAAFTLHPAPTPAATSDSHTDTAVTTGTVSAVSAKTRFLALGVGKSVVIDMPRTSSSSMPTASRLPPMTSRSSATSTACARR